MITGKALNDIVRKEISKIEDKAIEQMDLVEYTRIFFEKNYRHIKWVYSDDKEVNTDKKMFLLVRNSIEQVISLSKPNHTLHIDATVNPIKLGILYDWIELIPLKDVSTPSNKSPKNYSAVLNDRGKEIIEGWNKYINRP